MAAIGITTGVDREMAPILGEVSSTSFMLPSIFYFLRLRLKETVFYAVSTCREAALFEIGWRNDRDAG